MGMAKKKDEPFRVPDVVEVSDSANESLLERDHLREQCEDLKKRETHLSEQLRSYTNGGLKLEGSNREQAKALEKLRQQLAEVRHELVIVGRAREEAEINHGTQINKASKLVCEKVRPEWDQRIRACLLPLFEFTAAHVELMAMKDDLQHKEIRWLSFLPNVQCNKVLEALDRATLVDALNAGIIENSEIPQVLRDRFDI